MEVSRTKLTVLDQITASDTVRRKIIDTASALYVRKGFAATSIQEISETSGVSLPVTYHYVKNKSDIMRMIMEDILKTFRENLLRKIEEIDDPEEKLAIAAVLYLKILDRHREKALLIYQKSSSLDKASKSSVMALEVNVSRVFADIINEGIGQGLFKAVDVDLMAYNIIMMAHMWVLKGWHFKNRMSLDRYIDLQLEIIMDALRKD